MCAPNGAAVAIGRRQQVCTLPRCFDNFPLLKTVWPSGLRRWLKAPVRKGVGSNPTAVIALKHDLDDRSSVVVE